MSSWRIRRPCEDCSGRGTLTFELSSPLPAHSSNPRTIEHTCPACHGKGELVFRRSKQSNSSSSLTQSSGRTATASTDQPTSAGRSADSGHRSSSSGSSSGGTQPLPPPLPIESDTDSDRPTLQLSSSDEADEGAKHGPLKHEQQQQQQRQQQQQQHDNQDEDKEQLETGHEEAEEDDEAAQSSTAAANQHSSRRQPSTRLRRSRRLRHREQETKEEELADSGQQPTTRKRTSRSSSHTQPTTATAAEPQRERRRVTAATSELDVHRDGEAKKLRKPSRRAKRAAAAASRQRSGHTNCFFCQRTLHRGHKYRLPTADVLEPLGYHGPLPDERMCYMCYENVRNRQQLTIIQNGGQPTDRHSRLQQSVQPPPLPPPADTAVEGKEEEKADQAVANETKHCAFCNTAIGRQRYPLPSLDKLAELDYHGQLPDTARICNGCYQSVDRSNRLPEALLDGNTLTSAATSTTEPNTATTTRRRRKTALQPQTAVDSYNMAACSLCDKVWNGVSKRYNSTTPLVLKQLGYDGWLGLLPLSRRPKMCSTCYRQMASGALPRQLRRERNSDRRRRVEEMEQAIETVDASVRPDEEATPQMETDDERQSRPCDDASDDVDDAADADQDEVEFGNDSGQSDRQHDEADKFDNDSIAQDDVTHVIMVPLPFPDKEQQYVSLPVPSQLLTFKAVQQAAIRICSKRHGKIGQLKRSLLAASERFAFGCADGALSGVVDETFDCLQQCWQHWLPKDEWVKRWNELLHLWLALVWLSRLAQHRSLRAETEEQLRSGEPAIGLLTAVRRAVLAEAYLGMAKYRREVNEQLAVTAGLLRCQPLTLSYLSNPCFRIHALAGETAFEPTSRLSPARNARLIDRVMLFLWAQRAVRGDRLVPMRMVMAWLKANGQQQAEQEEQKDDGKRRSLNVDKVRQRVRMKDVEAEDDVYMDVSGATLLASPAMSLSPSSSDSSSSSSPMYSVRANGEPLGIGSGAV